MNFLFNKSIKLVLFLTVSLSSQQVMTMQQQEYVKIDWDGCKKALLSCPKESLTLAQNIKKRFVQYTDSQEDTATQGLFYLTSLLQCPFFMLNECADQDCPLGRYKCSKEVFEQATSDVLVKIIDAYPGKEIHYVGFGAGLLFSDFLIFVRTLEARPQANILFSAIDLKYGQFQAQRDCAFARQQAIDCIKYMFPQATFDIALIDNTEMTPVQLLEKIQPKPDIFVVSDLADNSLDGNEDAILKTLAYVMDLDLKIEVQYPNCVKILYGFFEERNRIGFHLFDRAKGLDNLYIFHNPIN